MTTSKTPPLCLMLSMSSSSEPKPWTKSGAGCNKTLTATVAVPVTRRTASATSSRAGAENRPRKREVPPTDRQQARLNATKATLATTKSRWRGSAHKSCVRTITATPPRQGAPSPKRSSTPSPVAQSPEIAHLGKTLKLWADAFLAYFDTDHASNGGTEAVNELIELHRRIARGFRNRYNYRLRMLLNL